MGQKGSVSAIPKVREPLLKFRGARSQGWIKKMKIRAMSGRAKCLNSSISCGGNLGLSALARNSEFFGLETVPLLGLGS
jgi:hypothetical protein